MIRGHIDDDAACLAAGERFRSQPHRLAQKGAVRQIFSRIPIGAPIQSVALTRIHHGRLDSSGEITTFRRAERV
ncbi:MAG: hypothetical protein ACI89J_001898 [Hyphomicrobiaceae bacterium]|jgi:hypothetical protein